MLVSYPFEVAVVDDDPITAALVAKICKDHNDFRSHIITNAANALQEIEQKKIRCVLLDISMPGEFGDELLRKLIGLECGIQVIILTADRSLTIAERCLNYGARDILLKPSSKKDIHITLDKVADHFNRWNQIVEDRVHQSIDKTGRTK